MPTGLSLAGAAQEAADVQFVVEVMQTEGVTWGGEAPAPGCSPAPKVYSRLAVGMDQAQLVASQDTKAPWTIHLLSIFH